MLFVCWIFRIFPCNSRCSLPKCHRPCMSAVLCHLAFAFVIIIFLLKIQCSPITDSAVDMNNKVPFSGIYYWGGSTHFQVATVSMSLYKKNRHFGRGRLPYCSGSKILCFFISKSFIFQSSLVRILRYFTKMQFPTLNLEFHPSPTMHCNVIF